MSGGGDKEGDNQMKKGSAKIAALRFVGCSLFGIFIFFVRIEIGGTKSIPADHMISWMKIHLADYYGILVLAGAACGFLRKAFLGHKKANVRNMISAAWSFSGVAISAALVFGMGPASFREAGKSAVSATGNILCAIFLSSVFVPFLVDYGLVDAAGVICRPFMRALFHTPGSSAVIGVSAFLGNYSVGHIVSKQMYDEGKFTEREMIIVATGFSTCSIGLMLNLVKYLDLMEYWNLYVLCVVVVTFAATAVTARLFPLCVKPNNYQAGVTAAREQPCHENMAEAFWKAGIARAAAAPSIGTSVGNILKRAFPMLCEITGSSIVIIVIGSLAYSYTDLFLALGSPFVPFLRLFEISGAELRTLIQALGISLLEPVLAGVVCTGKELSVTARWIAAIVPYSSVVFFAGFIPSLWSAGIPCKIWDLLILWAERTVIGICMAALAAAVIF